MSTRKTTVAGAFYPSDPIKIESMFEHYNDILDKNVKQKEILNMKPKAVIVPHAGYIYSAFTANIAYRVLANTNAKRVAVIGPSHKIFLSGSSVGEYDNYQTPFGNLKIDTVLVHELKENFGFSFIPEAHKEHSTEVQMPFLKRYMKDISVIEIVYGNEKPKKLAEAINYILKDDKSVVVISSDLSHYYDLQKANQLDGICLEAIQNLNTSELHQGCEACGQTGIEAIILSAIQNGLKPTLLDYRTSADVSGDKNEVVGYLSAAFA